MRKFILFNFFNYIIKQNVIILFWQAKQLSCLKLLSLCEDQHIIYHHPVPQMAVIFHKQFMYSMFLIGFLRSHLIKIHKFRHIKAVVHHIFLISCCL